MKLLIGLGNPGETHEKNRHNVGHLFVEFEIRNLKFEKNNQNIKIFKTNTFMNNSGDFVKKISRTQNLEPSHLFIAHDDLDLKLGTYKIQFGVGPKIHNGINNIEEVLGTKDFWRIRIGIESRIKNLEYRISGEDFVLQDFSKEELEILKQVQEDIYAELKDRFSKS